MQVKAAGVCMSDWHIMNGDWLMPLPMVLGHEAAGIVVENGRALFIDEKAVLNAAREILPGVRNRNSGVRAIAAAVAALE